METSLKTGFAQIFSCCPKNLSYPNFGGAAAPLAPPARTPMALNIKFWRARRNENRILAVSARENVREPLKLGLISGYCKAETIVKAKQLYNQ